MIFFKKYLHTCLNCLVWGLLFATGLIHGQQLNARVTVNTDQLASPNVQIFKTLEKSLTDLLNSTDWTGEAYKSTEKLSCSFFITVNGYDSGNFEATLQVQSSRPIFNSTYSSPIFNFNDKDFAFHYNEFDQLIFNINSFDSNLVSVFAFYSYLIIGLDQDSFSPLGGKTALNQAQQVLVTAQSSGSKGWTQGEGGLINRYFLISDLMSPTYQPYRDAIYSYHYDGLDIMYKDQKEAKEQIKNALTTLSALYKVRPNSLLNRLFFDAKVDEITSIFTAGPRENGEPIRPLLEKIAPLHASKWETLK